jgi:ABC-2 type transport system permease protein
MTSNFAIYRLGLKNAIAARLAYRADFLLSLVIVSLFDFLVPLITLLIYRAGATFPGWTMYEALLVQTVFMLVKGLAFPFFFGMIWNILLRVREGTFDLLLIQPRSILFLCIVTGLDIEDLGKLVGGSAMLAVVLWHIPPPGLLQWLQCVLLSGCALSVFFAFALILSGLLFKWVGNGRVWEIFDAFTRFGLYPQTIYSRGLQVFLAVIIPIAMIGFFPAAVLLQKPHPGMWLSVGICGLFLFASLKFWYWMLRNYTSAGG